MSIVKPLIFYHTDFIVRELLPGDTLAGAGGLTINIVVVTGATYNVTQTSGILVLLCDTTANNIIVNLNTVVGNILILDIKKTNLDNNSVTIDASGAETIDGGLTAIIYTQNLSLELIGDNVSNWNII